MNFVRSLLFCSTFFVGGISHSWGFDESDEYFCKNCVDEASAATQAAQYAPPLMCSSDGSQIIDPSTGTSCFTIVRRIILGNHLTNAVFAFDVTRGDEAPWAVATTPVTLPSAEAAGYRKILKLRREWEALLRQGIEPVPFSPTVRDGDAAECPEGTALDAYFSNQWQSEIRNQIAASIAAQLVEFQNSQPWILRAANNLVVGLTVMSMRLSLMVPDSDDIQTEIPFTFHASEVPNNWGINDRLVYNVELGGMTAGEPPNAIVGIDLDLKKSRAAGEQLDRLLSGQTDVTDACALEKLDRRDVIGGSELRVGNEPLNPDGSVGSGGSGGGASGGTPTRMCVFDFFVNGRYQYSFTAPCDAFEKDEISE